MSWLLFPALAWAIGEEAKTFYDQGVSLYQQGDYEGALAAFDQGLALESNDIGLQLYRGRALAKLDKNQMALDQFLRLVAAGHEARKAALVEIAGIYARTQNHREAVDYYTQALELLPDRGDIYLARGSSQMELANYPAAETDFKRTADVSPDLAARAHFSLAVLNFRRQDYRAAKAELDTAEGLSPDPALARQIGELQKAAAAQLAASKWWSIQTSMLFQYDDNVSLEPLDGFGQGAPDSASSDKDDYSFGFNFIPTVYFMQTKAHQIGVDYMFRGLWYFDLDEFNVMSHTLGAFYAGNRDPFYYRVRVDAGYYSADDEDKMFLYSFSPTFTYAWSRLDRTELLTLVEYKDMQDDTDNAVHYVANPMHYHTFISPQAGQTIGLVARGGGQVEYEDPDGDDGAEYLLYELKTGLSFPIYWQIEGDVGFSYAWVDYEQNDNIDPDDERSDERYMVSAKLGRAFAEYFRVDLQWIHTRNNSNLENAEGIDLYEFERNVFTLMLSGLF